MISLILSSYILVQFYYEKTINFLCADCMDAHPVVGNCTKNGQVEWNNEQVSGVNKEEACQIAIPFADERQAATSAMEESPYYMTLSGTWKFHWVADPEDRPKDFYRTDYDVSRWDDIKVPATWQIEAVRNNKNWDKPLYCNTIYPFSGRKHIEWPNVIQPRPADYTFATMPNPVGSYRRDFILPESWKGRDVFIRFNGVEAGFYIWVMVRKWAIRKTVICLLNLILRLTCNQEKRIGS